MAEVKVQERAEKIWYELGHDSPPVAVIAKYLAEFEAEIIARAYAESGQDEYRRGLKDAAKAHCYGCAHDIPLVAATLHRGDHGSEYRCESTAILALITDSAERSPSNSERDEYRRGWKAAKEAARAVSSAKYTVVFKLRQFAPNEVSRQELEVSGRFISEVEAEIGALEPDEHYRVGQEEK
jgi:hypothetical protein